MYFNICKTILSYKICNTYESINKFIKCELNEEYNTNVFSNLIEDITNLNIEDEYKEIKSKLRLKINILK